MRAIKLFLLKWTRTIHIYLSMFALLALFFFAATGFMLNHPEWFDLAEAHKTTAEADLPTTLFAEPLDKLQITERLRADHRAVGLVDSFEIEEKNLRIVFHSAGHTIEFRIDRESGHLESETESFGLIGRLTDLHRGKYVGPIWSSLIDIVSISLLLISLTGLILWLSLRRRFVVGVLAMLLGSVAMVVIYFVCVP